MTRNVVIATISMATASNCRKAKLSGLMLLLSGGAIVTVLSPRLRSRCQRAHPRCRQANAGTRNPWYCLLRKASAAVPKRDSTARRDEHNCAHAEVAVRRDDRERWSLAE